MENDKEKIIAFIKYNGKLVNEGYLDARKSGEVLIGIDEIIRYFIFQEYPQIKDFEFEIPVKVRKGSWITEIPENIDKIAFGAFGLWMAGKYIGSALETIAKNDFKDVSFKDLIKKAFNGIIYVIKLSKHLGSLTVSKFTNVIFSNNNDFAKITNENGEELWVPVEVLELYTNCPQNIFNKLTKIIEEERELIFGVNENDITIEESINNKFKYIFTKNDDDDEIVLPELRHGEYVEIEGHITRGNEKSNTIGFLHKEHILACYPEKGNIKNQKNNLFSNCLLKGFVDRIGIDGNINEKRPRIKFLEIINLELPIKSLFD